MDKVFDVETRLFSLFVWILPSKTATCLLLNRPPASWKEFLSFIKTYPCQPLLFWINLYCTRYPVLSIFGCFSVPQGWTPRRGCARSGAADAQRGVWESLPRRRVLLLETLHAVSRHRFRSVHVYVLSLNVFKCNLLLATTSWFSYLWS